MSHDEGKAGSSKYNTPLLSDTDDEKEASKPRIQRVFGKTAFPVLSSTDKIESWFCIMESWFTLHGIRSDNTRFNTLVTNLKQEILDQVIDIVRNPPAQDKFKAMKKAITDKFADSESARVQKLITGLQLGDRKPSHLLAELRSMNVTDDEKLLKVLWVQRLPLQARTILASLQGNLEQLSQVADAVVESLQLHGVGQVVAPIATSQMVTQPASALEIQIAELAKQVAELSRYHQRGRSRERSNSKFRYNKRDNTPKPNRDKYQPPTCWYHRTFGTNAQKCQQPCDFPSNTLDNGSKN